MILDVPLGSPGQSLDLSTLCAVVGRTVKCLIEVQKLIIALCQLSSLNSSKMTYSILNCKIHKYPFI